MADDELVRVFPETQAHIDITNTQPIVVGPTRVVTHRQSPSYSKVGPRRESPPVDASEHIAAQQDRLLRPDPVPPRDWATLVWLPMSFGAVGAATMFVLLALSGWLVPQ